VEAAEAIRARENLAALESVLTIAQREDAVVREAAGARRGGISTVLGFNGVLIGLSVFAAGNVASDKGVLAGSDLLEPFAILAGLAIVALTIAALALLVALLMDAHTSLDEDALASLDALAAEIEAGKTGNPTNAMAQGIRLIVGKGKVLDLQRGADSRQGKVARAGLLGTGVGFVLLAAAGLVVIAEVL
jgi:hypothetical protein